jgi:hypothetical protein
MHNQLCKTVSQKAVGVELGRSEYLHTVVPRFNLHFLDCFAVRRCRWVTIIHATINKMSLTMADWMIHLLTEPTSCVGTAQPRFGDR